MKYFNKEKVEVRGSLTHGSDCSIDINVIFEGKVLLGNNVTIESNCIIKDSEIGSNTIIKPFSLIEKSIINESCNVGPYANLRKGSKIDNDTSIGNFVEIKDSRIGKNCRINHLSFIGDSTLEENVTIGASTITCNHNGNEFKKIIIRKNSYIGSGTKLIAPLEIGENATIGSGSVITKNVVANKLTLSRSKQVVINHWVRRT